MKLYLTRILRFGCLALAAVPISVVTHELGHFAAYHLFGAANVVLHSASVSADKESLSNAQMAVANIVGPLITYATILLAFFITRRSYSPFWILLALAAPLGRLVNAVYIYFRALGYSPNPNFDEYNFGRNVAIDPLLISIPTVLALLVTFIYFLRKAWMHGHIAELAVISGSLIIGIAAWFSIGPVFLP
jgi:hypothetical protein